MSRQPIVIVGGALANRHLNAGGAWVRLNWLLALRRLGCLVYFVEQIRSSTCVDQNGDSAPFLRSANLQFFTTTLRDFGFDRTACLVCDDGSETAGLSLAEFLDVADAADVLVNISGHVTLDTILRRVKRKAYIDLDPGFTHFWHEQGMLGTHLASHDTFFTVGENVGTPASPIPTGGMPWRRKPRFLVLDEWPVSVEGDRNRFTTVAAWRGAFGPVEHSGRRYGLKVHEFRKFISLPTRAPQTFEIALSIHPADRADLDALTSNGWRITNPLEAARDPIAFRRYLQQSGGEFSAAQGIYVETESGWLSDRTVRYLASGKPCLVQDTGFSRNYPVGDGLVPFRTLDDAVRGAERIAEDYPRHARRARELAEAHFDSDRIVPDMLDQMGVQL